MNTQVTTIDRDIVFFSLFDEVEKSDISKFFQQNIEPWSGFGITTGTIVGNVSSVHDESEISEIPGPFAQDTSASLELNFDEETESGVTQEFADIQQQRLAFPTYDEEDILNWDAVVVPPPPRRSGTIRVRLIYKGRSKPIPVEDPWE